jgi:hypothetical protein
MFFYVVNGLGNHSKVFPSDVELASKTKIVYLLVTYLYCTFFSITYEYVYICMYHSRTCSAMDKVELLFWLRSSKLDPAHMAFGRICTYITSNWHMMYIYILHKCRLFLLFMFFTSMQKRVWKSCSTVNIKKIHGLSI